MTMIFIIIISIIIIATNYSALAYGIRLGKAMQKEVPPTPIEVSASAVRKIFKLFRDRPKKSYVQKKPQDKEEYSIFD